MITLSRVFYIEIIYRYLLMSIYMHIHISYEYRMIQIFSISKLQVVIEYNYNKYNLISYKYIPIYLPIVVLRYFPDPLHMRVY